jgi:hypothetical protein
MYLQSNFRLKNVKLCKPPIELNYSCHHPTLDCKIEINFLKRKEEMFAGIFKSSSTKLNASVEKSLYSMPKTSINFFSYPDDRILLCHESM